MLKKWKRVFVRKAMILVAAESGVQNESFHIARWQSERVWLFSEQADSSLNSQFF